jgi:hypothetical protein
MKSAKEQKDVIMIYGEDEEKVLKLREFLLNYRDVFAQIDTEKDIIDAYLLRKPMAFVEFYDVTPREIHGFINGTSPYFFICAKFLHSGNKSAHVFLSRFKTVIGIVSNLEGLDDSVADVFGLFCGYSPTDVFKYCKTRGFKELINL